MLGEDNMEQSTGKTRIDDTILNILKGNIKAEDAIKEEQMEKVSQIFDEDSLNVDEEESSEEFDSFGDIGTIQFDADEFRNRNELDQVNLSESNYGAKGFDDDLKYGLRDRSEFEDIGEDSDKPSLGLNIDFGGGLHSNDLGLGETTSYIKEDYGARDTNFRVTLGNQNSDSTGGRRLGEPEGGTGGRLGQQVIGGWDYRTLPNKMLELVKNMGNMKQEGTGYFADSESEMLTVLAYLNYGETTGTTESMREQIDEACKNLENRVLLERDDADRYK
ncbi:MAG: hypothetical protein IJT72_09720 [Lachnospiraceae bacterium]|nr:hypothetical protein [Lachnospiraceae bacterium]